MPWTIAWPSRPARTLGAFLVAALSSGCSDRREPVAPAPDAPEVPVGGAFVPRIAFTSTRDGSSAIYVANEDGSGARRLTRGERPAWSPDGQRIAFHWWDAPNSTLQVRVINVDGTGERVVAESGGLPSWSPDGTKIVFNTVVGATNGGIYVVNVDGSGLTLLLSTEFEDPGGGDHLHGPVWSPDGKTIAFVRTNYDKGWQIHLMNADGSSPRALATAGDQTPSWSPDGTMLAFGSFQSIGSVNADGTGLRLYSPTMAFDPDWSPDGRSLIYNSFSSRVGDSISRLGSRMRIYILDRESGAVRQLIPEATNPALPNYWDEEAVWLRVTKGLWDY